MYDTNERYRKAKAQAQELLAVNAPPYVRRRKVHEEPKRVEHASPEEPETTVPAITEQPQITERLSSHPPSTYATPPQKLALWPRAKTALRAVYRVLDRFIGFVLEWAISLCAGWLILCFLSRTTLPLAVVCDNDLNVPQYSIVGVLPVTDFVAGIRAGNLSAVWMPALPEYACPYPLSLLTERQDRQLRVRRVALTKTLKRGTDVALLRTSGDALHGPVDDDYTKMAKDYAGRYTSDVWRHASYAMQESYTAYQGHHWWRADTMVAGLVIELDPVLFGSMFVVSGSVAYYVYVALQEMSYVVGVNASRILFSFILFVSGCRIYSIDMVASLYSFISHTVLPMYTSVTAYVLGL